MGVTMARRTFEGTALSVPAARRYVTDVLAEHLLDAASELGATAALLVSELATNAVLYGGGAYEVSVACSRSRGYARIGVTDIGPGEPQLQDPAETAEHGRGLRLVAALSDGWGTERSRRGEAKTVWFKLRVA